MKDGETPLTYNCINENIREIKKLIKNEADINSKNKYDDAPLSIACKMGYKKIVEYLIMNGADINIKNNNGDTAIMLTLYRDDISMINYLYKNGANINTKNNEGNSFMSLIKNMDMDDGKREKMINEIKSILNEQRKDGETALTFLCKAGNAGDIHNLIKFGVDVNAKNSYGDSPLALLCKNNKISNENKIKLMKGMIKRGANLNTENRYGFTPLMIAKYSHNKKLKEFIKSNDISAEDSNEDTLLNVAIHRAQNQDNNQSIKEKSVIAKHGFIGSDDKELNIKKDDKLKVLKEINDWYYGYNENDPQKRGFFPKVLINDITNMKNVFFNGLALEESENSK
eukprot:jgi/Orpsp1_1/1190218/evm.model.d7180000077504.1